MLAIALNREVGVDIERERDTDVLAVSERFFGSSEHAALAGLRAARRRSAFFKCWVRKESFIKAIGAGLSFPLTDIVVDPLDTRPQRVIHAKTEWTLLSLNAEPGYATGLTFGSGDMRRMIGSSTWSTSSESAVTIVEV